jgi:hypothetical protein
MSDSTKIRIAQQMARELEFEVDDVDEAVASIEKAMAADADLVWIVDNKGHRHGIAVDKLAFVEIEVENNSGGVGFASGS